jgi:hypothetical protein
MNVIINNIEELDFTDSEAVELLSACVKQASRFINDKIIANIWVGKRIPETEPFHRRPGWLEFNIYFHNEGKCVFQIGAIQRKPQNKFEFHS